MSTHFGAPGRPARARRWLLLGAIVALGAAVVACEDDGDDAGLDGDGDVAPTNLEFTIGEGGIEPPQEQVRVPDRYQVIVTNDSDADCSFYLGGFLRDLDVPAGETNQIYFHLPPTAPDGEEVEMGCEGDEEKQGIIIVLNATGSDLGG